MSKLTVYCYKAAISANSLVFDSHHDIPSTKMGDLNHLRRRAKARWTLVYVLPPLHPCRRFRSLGAAP